MTESSSINSPRVGTVYLVGAGPGNLGLLTLRGMEIVSNADVILYDRLLCDEILKLKKPDAEAFFVGKTKANHSVPQDDINELLVLHAKNGRSVCRLKGGDPFVFGRGGEEASFLHKNGVPFEVVPGVTSAVAVPAYAGIPVTDRRHSSSFSVITGHTRSDLNSLDWQHLATTKNTLVFLMGLSNIEEISTRLISKGSAPSTPVAVIEQGCSLAQRVVTGELANINKRTREAAIKSPAVIVIGNVVHLREELNWFETKPLFGKRILVTRAKHQSEEIASLLREFGAEPILCPLIRQECVEPTKDLLSELKDADWLLFTSANALPFLLEQLKGLRADIRALGTAAIGAVGPATARSLEHHGLRVSIIPSSFTGESFGVELPDPNGKRVVIVRAKEGREPLAEILSSRGADVRIVAAYETLPTEEVYQNEDPVDLAILTSPSTAQMFAELFSKKSRPPVAAIGPVTAEAAQTLGLDVALQASEHSMRGLVDAIVEHFSSKGDRP